MIIAVLKETADYERRVALTPPADSRYHRHSDQLA